MASVTCAPGLPLEHILIIYAYAFSQQQNLGSLLQLNEVSVLQQICEWPRWSRHITIQEQSFSVSLEHGEQAFIH